MAESQEVPPGKERPLSGDDIGQADTASPNNPAAFNLRSVEEFLSAISHDLKGPLSVILIQAQLAQREVQDATVREGSRLPDHLAGIVTMCQKMAALIEDLLDVTRAQMGLPIHISLQPADLVDLVQRVMARQPRRSEWPLDFKPYPSPLLIQADVPRLERLVANLASNALKVASVDAPIVVGVDRVANASGSWATLTIAHTGPEAQVVAWRTLLERLARAGTDPAARDSLGLGWLSAAQVMAQHNGSIDVATSGDPTLLLRFPLLS